MISKPYSRYAIISCLAFSFLVHLVCIVPLDFLKPFQLGIPVLPNQPIMVDLQQRVSAQPPQQLPLSPSSAAPSEVSDPQSVAAAATIPEAPRATVPEGAQPTAIPETESGAGSREAEATPAPAQQITVPPRSEVPAELAPAPVTGQFRAVSLIQRKNAPPVDPPLRKASEFLANDWEKLSYRISMSGIPVGMAELEARQDNGEIRITLRIQSNAAVSQLYPVDDSVETRHIGGNFILSRIRQREGSYRGDKGFTLFLRDKSVFWIDRIRNLTLTEPLPNSSVVDILSGLYFLRNQPLEVGTSVVLQLFDSNRYAATTVVVLRKEHLTLPSLREVDTLLIHPQLKTEGVFRRTGEILVWLTDDEKKVPVKVETRIALGKVTAELVSAETHSAVPPGDASKVKVERQVDLKSTP